MSETTTRARKWLAWHSVRAHITAPIWLRIPEKQRWTIVNWLDKSRRRCWSELVSDALAVPQDDPCDVSVPTLRADGAPRCAAVCGWLHPDHAGDHDCSCYCGKFQFTAHPSDLSGGV
jgi:hypothetical protein